MKLLDFEKNNSTPSSLQILEEAKNSLGKCKPSKAIE